MNARPTLLGTWSCDFPRPEAPRGNWPGALPREPWDGRETYEDFMCVCQDDGRAECDAVRAWAKDALGADDADLVSKIVYAVACWFDGTISMDADQWARVTVRACPTDNMVEGHKSGWELVCRVDCDRLEDGLACCLSALCERFPAIGADLLERAV